MKITINRKRYNTSNCEAIASRDHRSHNNYSGTTTIYRASDGQLIVETYSNGQDCFLQNRIAPWSEDEHFDNLSNYDMTDTQEARAAELGLITIVP